MNLSRRSLLIAAPAVILTPHLLMPVRPWLPRAFLAFPDVGGFFVEDGHVLPLSDGYQVGDVIIGKRSGERWRCINAHPPTTWERL